MHRARHRTTRLLAALAVLTVLGTACSGSADTAAEDTSPDAQAADEQAAEDPAEDDTADATDTTDGEGGEDGQDTAEESAPEPEEEAAPPASAEEVAASASGPSGFEEQPQAEGGHPALQYVIELSVLTDQPDPTPELSRIDASAFVGTTTRVWLRPAGDELQDVAAVVVADFGTAEDAAAEFDHLRALADQAVAGDATEVDADLGGEQSFAVAAAFGMVPIGPDGEPEREPPIATLGVVLSGSYVVLVSTSITDGPTDGSGVFAELAGSVEL